MSFETWEVRTGYGPVAGRVEDGIGAFLGIPYGQLRVEPGLWQSNRFVAPQPPDPWIDSYPAHAFGPTPPRGTAGIGDLLLGGDPALIGGINQKSTDWLTINVWAQRRPGQPRPVMVWIHGGAFVRGASAGTAYDGTAFARDGVVLVSFNYRLGLEGFGYLPDAPAPANRGLLDQILALQWVRDNIENFGGDPGNVTVFGESAGAMSILALMASRPTLFDKAIVQSGTAHIAQSTQDAALVVAAVAEKLKVEPTATALRAVAFSDLIAAQQQVHQEVVDTADPDRFGPTTIASCGMSFLPVVDNDVVSGIAYDRIRAGAGAHIPLLIGTTTEEHRLFTMPYKAIVDAEAKPLQQRLGVYGAPDTMYDKYASRSSAPYTRSLPCEVFSAVMSDRLFRISTIRVAEARADRGGDSKTYVYELGWRSGKTYVGRHPLGACHVTDIPFVWDTLTAKGVDELLQDPPADLATAIHARWIEFAETGALKNWPVYNTNKRSTMTFYKDNVEVNQIVDDPRGIERQLWDNVELSADTD
ncbi:carboxylesterase family protein [Nocardia sp. NPDC046763]|uniref:carboxylesterase/lipase family protein n=1 Tax=Nocardia sp. NPDC046763 TaxID=3155256 RepID=UPI0033DB688D